MGLMFRSKQVPLHRESFPYTYEQLKRNGMPPSAFKNTMFVPEDLANYPGIPASGEGKVDFELSDAPAMRVQAYFIPGGLVLSMYMHHSVLDFSGVTTFWQNFCANVTRASGHRELEEHELLGMDLLVLEGALANRRRRRKHSRRPITTSFGGRPGLFAAK